MSPRCPQIVPVLSPLFVPPRLITSGRLGTIGDGAFTGLVLLEYLWVNWEALGGTGRDTGGYWEALGALGCTGRGTGMYWEHWDVLGCTGMDWEHWEVTPGDRRCPHSFIEDNEVGTIDPTALRGLRGLLYL